jgi:hypothetical protein
VESTRCPNCGALNPAEAQWCNQCLASFRREPEVEAVAEPREMPVALDADAGLPDPLVEEVAEAPAPPTQEGNGTTFGTPTDFKPPDEAVGTKRGSFAVKREGVRWTCSVCGEENALAASVCATCGTTFAASLRPPETIAEDKNPSTAALLSLLFPGAGHLYLDLVAQAVARAVVTAWVVVIAAVAAFAEGSGMARMISLVFGVIALALWAVNAHDAYREANGERFAVILKGRMYTYLVVGIIGLLMLMMTFAALQAQT